MADGLLALETLSEAEGTLLAELEARVERGRTMFIDVGEALTTIRDKRLYKQTHTAFGDYLQDRWHMSRTSGYRLIDAALVAGVVTESVPTWDTRKDDDPDWLRDLQREHGYDGGLQEDAPPDWERKFGGKRANGYEERRIAEAQEKVDRPAEAEIPPPANESVASRLAATAKKDPARAQEIWRRTVETHGPDATAEQVAAIANDAPVDDEDAKRCASAIRKAVKDRDSRAAKQALAIWRATVYSQLDKIAKDGR